MTILGTNSWETTIQNKLVLTAEFDLEGAVVETNHDEMPSVLSRLFKSILNLKRINFPPFLSLKKFIIPKICIYIA